MKSNMPLGFRLWQYFRTGYSIYLTHPIGIFNFLTLTFYLLIENIPFLKGILPNFSLYALIAIIIVLPVATFFGWWHIRRSRAYATESVVATINNPLLVHMNRVSAESLLALMEAVKAEPSNEFMQLLKYWRELDEEQKWRP